MFVIVGVDVVKLKEFWASPCPMFRVFGAMVAGEVEGPVYKVEPVWISDPKDELLTEIFWRESVDVRSGEMALRTEFKTGFGLLSFE